MRDLTNNIGENAGRIWELINEKGLINEEEILKISKLNKNEFFAGIGWLARENKVSKENKNKYKLDNKTNLIIEIGETAGKVFKVMDIWGEVDIPILQKLVGVSEEEINSALGWLAREGKIYINEKSRYNLK
ncbi:MAG: winged helix-turn-helix domain-containing protein [Thermoplasmatales archaeon]|nr:MAG: winged helix-turn-helix domain-containing protein [Thermoplasmatales archaeon]